METSILLAKIIGPILLVVGIGILINLEHYRKLIRDFAESPFQVYVSGILALVIGVLIVAFHNVWDWGWPLIITALGWGSILKGVVRIAAPGVVRTMTERYGRTANAIAGSAAAALVLGAVLTYFGFATAA